MQKFCHNCGKSVILGAKFCNNCGVNLSSLANVPAPATEVPKLNPPQRSGQFPAFSVNEDEDGEGDGYLDRLTSAPIRQNELHVEIVRDRPLGESVGALIAQATQGGGSNPDNSPRPPQYTDGQQFLSEFKKEAGTSREKS